ELHLGALDERLEAVAGDRGVVNEQILRSVVGGDEAVALRVVEHLNGSSCHVAPPYGLSRTGREVRDAQPNERSNDTSSVAEICRPGHFHSRRFSRTLA